jgi:hypothetical protein
LPWLYMPAYISLTPQHSLCSTGETTVIDMLIGSGSLTDWQVSLVRAQILSRQSRQLS